MAARNWEKELWSACENGVSETAQEALENGVDVNWENPQAKRYTPIHRATVFGQEKIVQLLLSKGANPNAMSQNKRTPLSSAALFGYKNIVILLLDKGANIETTVDDEMLTPLHLAAQRSHSEIVALLIERGAKINPKTNDGNTPLHLASQRGNPAVIQCLYNHGANLFIQNKAGKTPLELARKEQHSTTCSYLEECMKKENGLHKEKVLWTACHDGDFIKARETIASGADCSWANKDFNGYTSLHIATLFGHEEIAKLLLNAGASSSQVSENGDIPLITAAREGHEGIVELLLDCPKANIDIIDNNGSTALHKAAKHSHKKVVKLLIKRGANVNLKNKKGNTPLHLSSKEGHPMVLHYLLQHSANPLIENKDGKTALNLAEDQNNSISIGILLEESNESILWNSSKKGEVIRVKECISKSAKVSWRSPACNDYTSLHIATIYGHDEVVKILLEKGADPNDSNRNGFSPLITAANNGDLDIFNHLLKWNANINYQGIHRDTALHRAAKHSYRKMVEILVDKKAKLDLLNKDGNTPLHMAAMEGHAAVVRYLIKHGANRAVTNKQGKAAYDLAWENGHHPVLEEFKKTQVQVTSPHDESDPEAVDAGSSSSSIDERLWNQAAKGNFENVEECIKKKGSPAWKNRSYHGYTAILVATLNGHDKVVEVLLNYCGACARDTNEAGETALHIAAREGDKSLVKRLLDNGVVPRNAKNFDGDTALHLATKYSHRAIVKLLVKRKVDFNLQNKDGNTPLHLAYREGHVVIVNRLQGNGAKTDVLNHNGLTAEEMENQFVRKSHSISEHKVVVQITPSYHESAGVVSEDRKKHSEELWSACHEDNRELVKKLLEAEADTSWTNPELKNYTCLHVAVMFGNTVVINLLLNKGVYYDCTGNDEDHTPLHVAALEGRVEAAKLLVNKGAERDLKDRNHQTPLHLAVMKGHWKIVEYLIRECKVNIHEQNKDGNTALHIAVLNGNAVLAETLIKNGAHVDMQNQRKEVPLDLARNNHHGFLVKLLENADEYPMDTPTRGYCIIINNYKFDQHDRKGSEKDVEVLKGLFEKLLGFKVQTHWNLKAKEMLQTMEKVGLYEHRAPCLVVVVMSHGSAEGVWGTDRKPVPVTQLTKYISDSECPTLAGKPKLFLIQACRDTAIGDDVHISEPIARDMDITLATIHGESAYRSRTGGSFFIQAFVDTMIEFAATKSYKEMITILTDKLSKIQVPVQRTTLRKRLFLRPIKATSISSTIVDEPAEDRTPGEDELKKLTKRQMVTGRELRKGGESK